MTTIAYKNGIIAYDSYLTNTTTIIYKNYNKKFKRGNILFFPAGIESDYLELIDSYESGKVDRDLECTCLVVENNKIFKVANISTSLALSKCLVDLNEPSAIGSGSHIALGAMDYGASAYEAVKIAAGRDIYTGGKIRTYKL